MIWERAHFSPIYKGDDAIDYIFRWKMADKGWRFEGNERKYLDETLSSGFSVANSG